VTEWASNIAAGKAAPGEVEAKAPPTIAFDDAALVERCRQGDMQAFGSLVAKYQDRIYNTVLRICGHPSDAEEIAQEAFLKALERIGQFRGHSRFYTWLFRIASNLAMSHRRHSGRLRFQSLGGADDGDGTLGDALTAAVASRRNPGPETVAMAAETNRKVAEALEELDDEFRLVIVLRDIEDMDYSQISEVLEVPVGTVKSRLHRARWVLKEKLADLVG